MDIIGGFYREQCLMPPWNAVFGSGGRAAAAVSSLSPGSIFHTYVEDFDNEDLALLKKMGIEVRLSPRPTAIVFMYFHPLSRPIIQPLPEEIEPQPKITVISDAVLRFGFLEGDAIIKARRAVYDPQTWKNPAPFGANGSVATELAIVLNELELRSATGIKDLKSAALSLLEHQKAEIVVAKGGIRGATVFERGGRVISVPAYRSSRIFKIGTGDVFSAIFAYYWAEMGIPAGDAADIASRAVAAYCGVGRLPLIDNDRHEQVPIKFKAPCSVLLEGAVNTLGQRYMMEEAWYLLRELGVKVFCPVIDGILNPIVNAVLILADGVDDETAKIIYAKTAGKPTVVLRENSIQLSEILTDRANVTVVDDFTSSLYFVAWEAAEHNY